MVPKSVSTFGSFLDLFWILNDPKLGVHEEPFLSLGPFGYQDWRKRSPRGPHETPKDIFGVLLGAKMVPKLYQHGVKEVSFLMLGSKMVSDMVCKLLLLLDGFGIQKIGV